MDLSAIVARLKDRLTGVREVGAAANLEAAMQGNLATPAVYVIPLGEQAEEIAHTGVVEQAEQRLFGVMQVVDNRAASGGAAVLDLAALRAQVKAALIGWVPDASTGEPVLFASGELVDMRGSRLWWSDEFNFKGYYRSTVT